MKRNFAKLHETFGKLLLIGSAILWTSCDDNGSSVSDDVVTSSAIEPPIESSSSVSAQVSSSSEQNSNKFSSLLSIDDVVGKMVTDTTGLRDKCITKSDYCVVVAHDWGYHVTETKVRFDYSVKLDTLLSTEGGKMSPAKKNCLSELMNKLRIPENAPVYGVSPCEGQPYFNDEDYPQFKAYKGVDCKLEEPTNNLLGDAVGAITDDSYIKALSDHNDDVRETAIQELSKIDASMDSCAHLE